jgi:phage gp36-like protein
MAQALAITLAATAAIAIDGAGTAVDIETTRKVARVTLRVLAKSGARVLTVTLQTRGADTETWRDVGEVNLDQVLDAQLTVGPLSRYLRASWAFAEAGADTVTIEIVGEAHQVYALPSDFKIPSNAIAKATPSDKLNACIVATDEADGYIGGQYALPLISWGSDVTKFTAVLAVRTIVQTRGVDPTGSDAGVLDQRDEAIRWFDRLASGRLSPPGIVDSTEEEFEGGSVVVSNTSRGW